MNESQRLLHGRGRCYPGFEQICVDWFSPVILITQFKAQEAFSLNDFKAFVLGYFEKNFSDHSVEAIVFQDRSQKISQSELLYGELPAQVFAREGRLKFELDLSGPQNIGYFLDAKLAREYLSAQVENKKVLNLFSYTCAFSVSALAASAHSVVNLDMGRGVLERGEINHVLNKIELRKAHFIKSDIFKAWKKLHKHGRYDWIIIDPPSFQKGSFNAEKDYQKIVKQLGKLLAPKAGVLACLNSPFLSESFLDDLFLNGNLNQGEHRCKKVRRLENPKAFKDIDPDSGLKVVVYAYERESSVGAVS